ncbi:U32 family peptidase [uncultured Ferrimonas sp.]|uniref:U32 family peptidase n=1 Tax=uncultured Ferrimonas sp. TaxID=432640 RepID=UPI0026396C93|nr:U32 family peptidase [uncultured Ferrimonas sp.]
MKLSLAANCWPLERHQLKAQIDLISALPVERVYLGETVCQQRDRFSPRELLALTEQFAQHGQQVVLSSLNLIASKRDLELTQQLTALDNVVIEANDMAAVALAHDNNLPFIAGAGLNIYNGASLSWLQGLGMVGYQPPMEMPAHTVTELMQQCQALGLRDGFELELLGWGYPLLAVSARCSSARVAGRNRQQCLKICQQQPIPVASSLAQQPMLKINGTQIHAAQPWDLLGQLDQLQRIGVQWLRVSLPDLQQAQWLHQLAEAIASGQPQFSAPITGSARLWQRSDVGADLCAD